MRQQGARRGGRVPHSGASWALPLMAAYGLALIWLVWQGPLSAWATVVAHCAGVAGIWWFSRRP